MTTEVDYSSDVCECGIVLHYDDPSVRPRHLCGDEAKQVAFALWIRHRVMVAEVLARAWRTVDDEPLVSNYEEKARDETEQKLTECGIAKDFWEEAKKFADSYSIEQAQTLCMGFARPEIMRKVWPKTADLMKEYFPTLKR